MLSVSSIYVSATSNYKVRFINNTSHDINLIPTPDLNSSYWPKHDDFSIGKTIPAGTNDVTMNTNFYEYPASPFGGIYGGVVGLYADDGGYNFSKQNSLIQIWQFNYSHNVSSNISSGSYNFDTVINHTEYDQPNIDTNIGTNNILVTTTLDTSQGDKETGNTNATVTFNPSCHGDSIEINNTIHDITTSDFEHFYNFNDVSISDTACSASITGMLKYPRQGQLSTGFCTWNTGNWKNTSNCVAGPSGSFMINASCTSIKWDGHSILSAECSDLNQYQHYSTLDYSTCSAGTTVSNINGNLTCDTPRS